MILHDLDKIVVKFDIGSNGYSVGSGGKEVRLPCLALVSDKYLKKGFMGIRQAKKNIGLFFVFGGNSNWNKVWMKNTYLPLDIIFVSKEGIIVEILRGKPMDETSIGGNIPAAFFIEVVEGFVKKNGILKGQKIKIEELK
jgi:hypothetical protein